MRRKRRQKKIVKPNACVCVFKIEVAYNMQTWLKILIAYQFLMHFTCIFMAGIVDYNLWLQSPHVASLVLHSGVVYKTEWRSFLAVAYCYLKVLF